MERATPVRKSHTRTTDLLAWPETPAVDFSSSKSSPPRRSNQPSDAISKVLFGGQITEEEAESMMNRKVCSGQKWKEMTGSGIFAPEVDDDVSDSNHRTTVRVYQQALNGMSQISFSSEESLSPRKPSSLPEVAKQRELSGNLENDSETKNARQISDAKTKELVGHDIFGPPPEILPRSVAIARSFESKEREPEPFVRNVRTSVRVSNPAGGQSNILFGEESPVKMARKMHEQKMAELSGNDIFRGGGQPASGEKAMSSAKMREISGSDIFADGKAESRDYLGGVRKPPGGESSIALV